MSNRRGSYPNSGSERITLNDVLKSRNPRSVRLRTPLSKNEERILEGYLARKKLMIYDRDLDEFKEER